MSAIMLDRSFGAPAPAGANAFVKNQLLPSFPRGELREINWRNLARSPAQLLSRH